MNMKYLIIGLFSLIFVSCESEEHKREAAIQKESTYSTKKATVGQSDYTRDYFRKIKFEGHSYIIYSGGPHMSGITHDMNCECLKTSP